MSPDTAPAVLYATGCAKASDWLLTNSARRRPVTAVVWRALRLTEMVMQYETEDNFAELLAAWEKGFDSLIPPAGATVAPVSGPAGEAPALLAELRHADTIIKAMLRAMSIQQKARVAEQLEADGVVTDGMSRHHERAAIIAAATSPASASNQLRDIEGRAVDVLSQVDHADILLQLLFEKLDQVGDTLPAGATFNCLATCTARAIVLVREAADNILSLAQEGGAA